MSPRSNARETVRVLIDRIATSFSAGNLYFGHGTTTAVDEAAWLVGHVLTLQPDQLSEHLDDRPDPTKIVAIENLANQRVQTRKPLAYLINEAWFGGYTFYVDERVIVPRSLTAEFILDRFEPWVDSTKVHRILDLCTGSGCMAILAAHILPHVEVDAVDLSPDALAIAQINVERHDVGDRIHLIESDLFSQLGEKRYDVIMTNPPYVAETELAQLPAEYKHEPAMALTAGHDGLTIITRILAEAPDYLNDRGILLAEVGNSQHPLTARFPRAPFAWLTTATEDDCVFLLTAEQLKAYRHELSSTRR